MKLHGSYRQLGITAALVLVVASALAKDEVAVSPYGPTDQIGALNQLTDASRLDLLRRVASGKVYDLSVETFPGMPGLVHLGMGDPDFHHWMTHTPEGLALEGLNPGDPAHPIALYDDAVIMSVHTGTHLDALNHAGYGDHIYNQFKSSEQLGNKGWRVAGADRVPPIITRGVLIDVAGWKKLEVLPASYEITPTDLEAVLAVEKIKITPGDAVFIHAGVRYCRDTKGGIGRSQASEGFTEARKRVDTGGRILGDRKVGISYFDDSGARGTVGVERDRERNRAIRAGIGVSGDGEEAGVTHESVGTVTHGSGVSEGTSGTKLVHSRKTGRR